MCTVAHFPMHPPVPCSTEFSTPYPLRIIEQTFVFPGPPGPCPMEPRGTRKKHGCGYYSTPGDEEKTWRRRGQPDSQGSTRAAAPPTPQPNRAAARHGPPCGPQMKRRRGGRGAKGARAQAANGGPEQRPPQGRPRRPLLVCQQAAPARRHPAGRRPGSTGGPQQAPRRRCVSRCRRGTSLPRTCRRGTPSRPAGCTPASRSPGTRASGCRGPRRGTSSTGR